MYSFYFDSSSCSGCKACQAACKDKHDLPVGMLWRRVYEVSGGGWQKQGEAWIADAYAYNLSISCNHCQQPACVEACPAAALYQRPDGLVLIEAEHCIGCKYCTWACPYGAPQYDPDYRVMTKCTGCEDNLAAGLPPACVAACPLRVLDFGDPELMQARYAVSGNGLAQSVPPLPGKELTQPGLLIRPHRDAGRTAGQPPRLANLEEVHTAPPQDERPLALFTVLAQMAVGAFITLGLFDLHSHTTATQIPVLFTGLVMAGALFFSLLHLGSPQRAYRAIANWRTSWLSREILSAGAFTAGLALFNFIQWAYPFYPWSRELERINYWFGSFHMHSFVFYLTALAGLALVYSISQVYRLRTVKVWDSWRTTAAFLITPALLGPLLALALMWFDRNPRLDFGFVFGLDNNLLRWSVWINQLVLPILIVQALIAWRESRQPPTNQKQRRLSVWRIGLLAGCGITTWLAGIHYYGLLIADYASLLSLIFALASELLGRWMFYEKKSHSGF